jgi:hypothetical protein
MTVEPYAEGEGRQTLLETEGGLPLLITRRVGEGRVFLLTSSVDVDWGNLPLAAVYMPLIQSMAATLGVPSGGTGGRVSGRVGERLAIPLPGSLAGVVVEGPSGPVSTVVDAGILSFMPTEAGPHRVGAPGVPVLANVAVNMDPAESDVRRQTSLARTAAHVDPDRFMHRVPLHRFGFWFALMLGLVGVALARRNTEEVIDAA